MIVIEEVGEKFGGKDHIVHRNRTFMIDHVFYSSPEIIIFSEISVSEVTLS